MENSKVDLFSKLRVCGYFKKRYETADLLPADVFIKKSIFKFVFKLISFEGIVFIYLFIE